MPMKTDDLIILLEIARCGSFLKAGAVLGLDNSTVSRRIAALERDLKAPVVDRGAQGCTLTPLGERLLKSCEQVEAAVDEVRRLSGQSAVSRATSGELSGLVRVATTEAFGTYIIAEVLARLHHDNPALQVEIVTQTRLSPYSVGADIEIGVGEPVRGRPGAFTLTDYRLGLYASERYLEERGTPASAADVADHSLIYYVEGLLRVADLDVLGQTGFAHPPSFASTSPHAQLHATRHGAGIGLLPSFIAEPDASLRRVLFDEVSVIAQFSAFLAPGRLRRPAATQVAAAIVEEVKSRQHLLLPTS
ncbi:LysR family transcriptional regulator [Streptomyces sp. NPDC050619]|uniref:LysR family transcriptional regulator n=1 Tax=Streptomyces sp. NPDC050619 TaxID=3157214 RepID=UPI003443941E